MTNLFITTSVVDTANFFIKKGDTFSQLIKVEEDGAVLDMTDYSFKMDIRRTVDDLLILQLTDLNSRIDISLVSQGIIILKITDIDTNNLDEQDAVFDLKWTDTNSEVKTILEGKIRIQKTVTR
jgi:hypothetical protein